VVERLALVQPPPVLDVVRDVGDDLVGAGGPALDQHLRGAVETAAGRLAEQQGDAVVR
jgi:hypothetical protein